MADRMLAVLQERGFRLLWLGQSASTVGDRLVFVAIALFVTEIGSTTDVGGDGGDGGDGGKAVYGTLAAAMGLGTVCGAVIGFRWRPERPMVAGMLMTLGWPTAIVVFALGLPVALLVVWFFIAGVGLALFHVWWHTALQQRIPAHALSRVSSYDWMGSLALLPLGYLLAGPVGAALGDAEVLVAGGAIALFLALLGLAIPDVWRLRALSRAG